MTETLRIISLPNRLLITVKVNSNNMDIAEDTGGWQRLLTIGAGTVALYLTVTVAYNVFFHPLRSYPGPWYRAATRLPYTVSIFQGNATHRVKEIHKRYGHVVRIAPDTLSYTCSQAWQDIYGFKKSEKRGNLPKDPKFYIPPPEGVHTISTAPDEDHRRLRRLQSHAFSEKALLLQEKYLQSYTLKFVACLEKEALKHGGVVDFVKWVNYLTTDIVGDLSFGQAFGGLETGKLHPWLDTMFTTLKTFTFMKEIVRLPSFMVNAAMACIPKSMLEHRKQSLSFGAEAGKRRMALDTDRSDIMSYILKHNNVEGVGMSSSEIEMAAITFIVAGSETTATLISGAVYLLLSNPSILEKVTSAVRSDFTSPQEFTGVRLQQHEYINAVLKESLRLYPPAPDMLFRSTASEGAIIAGEVVPPHTSVTMNIWAANYAPENFHRPNEYLPERWLKSAPAEFDRDDKAVFKPFSMGPRDCIGKNLAWAEMRMILAHLLWNFDLIGLEPDSEDWIGQQKIFFLWEKPPLKIRILPAKG